MALDGVQIRYHSVDEFSNHSPNLFAVALLFYMTEGGKQAIFTGMLVQESLNNISKDKDSKEELDFHVCVLISLCIGSTH